MAGTLRELQLKRAYSSDRDDILADFFIPALQRSVRYCRLAGFFSSTSLAVAAQGLLGLILNDGHMELIVCPVLSPTDVEAIVEAGKDPHAYITRSMLSQIESFEEEFERDHVAALGWMVANDRLSIRVSIPRDYAGLPKDFWINANQRIFHQKVGILRDAEGNCISFSGSINETASGWTGNIEEFKVFRNWEFHEKEYQEADIAKFDRFWNGQARSIETMDIPEAVRERLIQIAPDSIDKLALDRWTTKRNRNRASKVELFDYQKEAIEAWLDNIRKGIFEMATGTGKTYTALGCVEKAFAEGISGAVIATPYQHLSQQWAREIDKFGLEHGEIIFADSDHAKWKNQLADLMIDMSLGYKDKILVLTTHDSLSSADFNTIISSNRSDSRLLLVADEVHGLGAKKSRQMLSEEYEARLGLSATPHRWFDDVGTQRLMEYFNGVVYEFPLDRAINTVNPATGRTFLTPYRYELRFASLSEDEIDEYVRKTRAIMFARGKSDSKYDEDDLYERLLFARADIVKNAQAKYAVLRDILDELGHDIKWALVYCSPEQIDDVIKITNGRTLSAHRFTMEEGTSPGKQYQGRSEREYILERFAEGDFQMLIAMKCLDEGVDVPAARTAILMCSSSNPREYIQRIGRVIRRYKGKTNAVIYDIVVVPSVEDLPEEMRDIERRIFEKEMTRCKEIAETSENVAEILMLLDEAMSRHF